MCGGCLNFEKPFVNSLVKILPWAFYLNFSQKMGRIPPPPLVLALTFWEVGQDGMLCDFYQLLCLFFKMQHLVFLGFQMWFYIYLWIWQMLYLDTRCIGMYITDNAVCGCNTMSCGYTWGGYVSDVKWGYVDGMEWCAAVNYLIYFCHTQTIE